MIDIFFLWENLGCVRETIWNYGIPLTSDQVQESSASQKVHCSTSKLVSTICYIERCRLEATLVPRWFFWHGYMIHPKGLNAHHIIYIYVISNKIPIFCCVGTSTENFKEVIWSFAFEITAPLKKEHLRSWGCVFWDFELYIAQFMQHLNHDTMATRVLGAPSSMRL